MTQQNNALTQVDAQYNAGTQFGNGGQKMPIPDQKQGGRSNITLRQPLTQPASGGAPKKAIIQGGAGTLTLRTAKFLAKSCFFWVSQDKAAEASGLAGEWLAWLRQMGGVSFRIVLSAAALAAVLMVGFAAYGAWMFRLNILPRVPAAWQVLIGKTPGPGANAPGTPGSLAGALGLFRMTDWTAGPDHKFRLRWTDLGPGYHYQVVYAYTAKSERDLRPLMTTLLERPGATVDLFYNSYEPQAWLSVAAIDPSGKMVGTAPMVKVELNAMNRNDSVEEMERESPAPPGSPAGQNVIASPASSSLQKRAGRGNLVVNNEIASSASPIQNSGRPPRNDNGAAAPLVTAQDATRVMQASIPENTGIAGRIGNALAVIAGKAVTSGPSAPAPIGVPVPQNPQWERAPGGDLRIRWQSVGPGYRYVVYGGYAGPHPVYDPCTTKGPKTETNMLWTPPATGPKVYDLYVVALDSKGNESMPSEHMIIDLGNPQ